MRHACTHRKERPFRLQVLQDWPFSHSDPRLINDLRLMNLAVQMQLSFASVVHVPVLGCSTSTDPAPKTHHQDALHCTWGGGGMTGHWRRSLGCTPMSAGGALGVSSDLTWRYILYSMQTVAGRHPSPDSTSRCHKCGESPWHHPYVECTGAPPICYPSLSPRHMPAHASPFPPNDISFDLLTQNVFTDFPLRPSRRGRPPHLPYTPIPAF